MSVFSNSLVLRNAGRTFVCEDFRVGGQPPRGINSYCPCFTPGALIKTDSGERLVEDIAVGSRVLTRDNGYQTVVWVGQRDLGQNLLQSDPTLQPILISKGALGPNLPERDIRVSPQHRMLLNNDQIRDWFDADEVLVAAHLLTCFEGITREAVAQTTYIHFMFEQHEIVLADGAWSESYQPSDLRSGAMDERHRIELLKIFPRLEDGGGLVFPTARTTIEALTFSDAIFQSK